MKNVLTACAALLATLPASPAAAQMKPPVPLTLREFAAAGVGSRVQIAVRVEGRVRSALHAELIERETDARYRATGKHVDLYDADGTPIVMGTPADIKPGAVVFVTGVVTGKYRADAKQLLVVTSYVSVH